MKPHNFEEIVPMSILMNHLVIILQFLVMKFTKKLVNLIKVILDGQMKCLLL